MSIHAIEPEQAASSTADAPSLLDRFRAERAKSVAGEHVHLKIPGYSSLELLARYRFVDTDETKPIGDRIGKTFDDVTDQMLYATMDILIAACEGIYMREPGSTELVLVDPDNQGPMGYEVRLADFLEIDHAGARDIVMGVFRGNKYAIVDHGQRLQRWLSDTTARVDEAAPGEA